MKNNKIINRLFITLFVTFSMFAAEVNGDDKKNQSREKSAPRAHTKEAFMDSNDEDGDGIVSKEEFLAIRELSHAEKDLNRDGIVTEAEYVAEWEQRLDKQLAKQREASVKQASKNNYQPPAWRRAHVPTRPVHRYRPVPPAGWKAIR